MGINTLTPRYLNLDNDSRIVAPQEMIDALNIRVSADSSGNQGVVKNIKGSTAAAYDATPYLGENQVIGTYEHEGTNRLFVFVWNSNGHHSIYKMGQGESSFTLAVRSQHITLTNNPLHIDAMVVSGEVFLYFTDGQGEPQKVNVDSGIAPSNGESNVMKLSPLAPQVSYLTDNTRTTNDLLGKSFQFALQHVFRDGEVSAIGEYSDNTVGINTLNDIYSNAEYDAGFNKIQIQLSGIVGIGLGTTIPKLRLHYRDVQDNTMYYVGEYTFSELFLGVDFFNDGSYSVVSDSEYNKLQDAVPKVAQSQTISANRLMYGNYKEGFDKETITASLVPTYSSEPISYRMFESADAGQLTNEVVLNTDAISSALNGTDNINLILDYAVDSYTYTKTATETITIKNVAGTTVQDTTIAGNVKFKVPRTRFLESVDLTAPSSQADFNTKLVAAIDGLTVTNTITNTAIVNQFWAVYPNWNINWGGTVTQRIEASVVGTTIVLTTNVIGFSLFTTTIQKDSGSGMNDYTGSARVEDSNVAGIVGSVLGFHIHRGATTAFTSQGTRTFKAGETHSIGLVLEDSLGRTSGVYELGSASVAPLGDRLTGERGTASITVTPTTTIANAAFARFFYVYSGGNTKADFIQYGTAGALKADAAATDLDIKNSNQIYVMLRGLQGSKQSYAQTRDLEYQFTEGDKLVVVSYLDADGIRQYPSNYTWDVNALVTIDTAAQLDGAATSVETGQFITLDNNEDLEGFGLSDIGTSSDLWASDVIFEIYSREKSSTTKIYRSLSPKYAISEINNAKVLTQGNAWYKQRSLNFANGSNTSGLTPRINYVESKQFSDRDASTDGELGGKPYAVINSEKEQHRISSITYSDPQLADSSQNNLSSFNNSLANFMDYEMNYGGIFGLVDSGDAITLLQSDKVSRVPVNRSILSTGSGAAMVTQTTDVLGLQQHYPINTGINEDRTAFLKADGVVYIVDVTRAKIVAFSGSGNKILSDNNVSSYIETTCSSMLADADGYFVSIGQDRLNNEIIFSLQNLPFTYSKSLILSVGLDKFTTFVNYTSNYYATLGMRSFGFRKAASSEEQPTGQELGVNAVYGNFFGTQYDATLTAVFNSNPTSRKVYNSIGVDATANPSATLSTIDQSVDIPEAAFTAKEGVYYSNVPREEGTSQYVMLGNVSLEADPAISFAHKVNRLPFRMGGDVYKFTGGAFAALAGVSVDGVLSSRSLSMVNAGSVTAGDTLAVKGASVDGDPLRGAYSEVKLTFNDTTAIEVFALSAQTSESGLHHNSQQ